MEKKSYRKFTVILPTLNEEKSIGKLIDMIARSYEGISILVVDDNSDDGTEEVVRRASRRKMNVSLLVPLSHGRLGLTGSIIRGIELSRTEFVIIMDADLQHNPKYIGQIAEALNSGADLAIAVRENVEGWMLYRRIISRMFIVAGNAVLHVRKCQGSADILSGFFGMRRLRFMNVYRKNSMRFVKGGYKILFDFLKCTRKGSINVHEIGYTFDSRKYGASKAGVKQGLLLLKSFLS
jgi:dolichol-phosphate mannosyltransferase